MMTQPSDLITRAQAFRAEVQDKLSVARLTRNQHVVQQCEDFLVEQFAAEQERLIGILSGLQCLLDTHQVAWNHCQFDYDVFRAELSAAVSGLHQETWYPIASAPKDEDVLLLYLEGSGVLPGYWDGDQWLACETSSLTGGKWHEPPTHWRPLPSPPSVEGSVLIEHKEETDHARMASTGRSAPNIDAGNNEAVPLTVSDTQVNNEPWSCEICGAATERPMVRCARHLQRCGW